MLEPLEAEGFRILHDRRIPGSRRRTSTTSSIGPPGIFVVETKSLGGSLQIHNNNIFVAGRRKSKMIDEVKREAAAVETALAAELVAGGRTVGPSSASTAPTCPLPI